MTGRNRLSGDDAAGAARTTRYARHHTLAGFGPAGQESLAGAKVLVVGAGGLGSPVLAYLAAAGVGTIGVVDDDTVDLSNLQRQIVHTEGAVGTAKTTSAARFVSALNSDITVETHDLRLSAVTALDVLAGYDFVVDGSDTFRTRYLLNDACVLLGIPMVWASVLRFEGQLGVIDPGRGPCYRCLFPEEPGADTVPDCSQAGVLGVVPGVMGTLEGTEVIKLLAGIGEPLVGRVLLYDALAARTNEVTVSRDPACVTCQGTAYPALTVGAEDVVVTVDSGEARERQWIDVREPDEQVATPIPNIPDGGLDTAPLAAWTDGTVADLLDRSRRQPLALVCARGARSHAAAARLIAAGARPGDVVSVRGGVDGMASGV